MAQQAFPFAPGKYYIVYPDGGKSMCMPKGSAKNYANMFGGTVCRHPDFPTLRQKILAFLKRFSP